MERNTRQRAAILDALSEANRPLSPQEVLVYAKTNVSSLGIATVYRTLNAFEQEGITVPVSFPGDPTRYEISGKGHHHHFRCRRCKRVFEVKGCMGSGESITPKGFMLEAHELMLLGLCKDCSD